MSIAMPPQHKSLRDEILYVLGRASAPLDSGQIYERCTLAEEIKRVGDALWFLRDTKKIVAVEGEGRKRYMLARNEPAPVLPAAEPESAPVPETKPAAPAIEIPVLTAAKPKRGAYKKRTAAADAPDVVPGVAQQIKPVSWATKAPANAVKIADAMLAEVREQLGRQMAAPAESLGEQRLAASHAARPLRQLQPRRKRPAGSRLQAGGQRGQTQQGVWQGPLFHAPKRRLQGSREGRIMSHPENARVTNAIAKNVGIRWCSSCNSDKPAEGFKKIGVRWICVGCQTQRKNRTPGTWMQGGCR